MPYIDELYYYDLQHSGQEIDGAVDAVQAAEGGKLDIDWTAMSDTDLIRVESVAQTFAEQIIVATVPQIAVAGSFTRTYSQGVAAAGDFAEITPDHYLLRAELSDPTAMASDWTVTTGNRSVTIAGTGSGNPTTMILILGKRAIAEIALSQVI